MKRVCWVFCVSLLFCSSISATDFPVHSGGNIQTAINSAAIGDTVTLDAGTTYDISSPLVLPLKGGCTGAAYVTIRSSELSLIVVPIYALRDPMSVGTLAHMATIRTTSGIGEGIFDLAAGAGCYQLQGLKLTDNTAADSITYIDLNGGAAHFVIDRIAIIPRDYPYSGPQYHTSARIGVIANATDVTVKNSDLLGLYGVRRSETLPVDSQVDSECILTDVGPCNPCVFDNNYLEGGFDPIFLGGADPPASATAIIAVGSTTGSATLIGDISTLATGMTLALQEPDSNYPSQCNHPPTAQSHCYGDGIVQTINYGTGAVTWTPFVAQESGSGARVNLSTPPLTGGVAQWNGQRIRNVTITHNHIHLRTDFYLVYLAIPGKSGPKSYIEIKFVDTLLYEGNYHDGWYSNWGFASYNQNGGGVWTQEKNITCRNNWFNGFNMAMSIPMADPYYLNTKGDVVEISNNLWTNPDNSGLTHSDPTSFVLSGHYGGNVVIKHNTILTGYPNTYTGKSHIWDWCPGQFYGQTGPIVFRDNIFGMGNYGFPGEDGPMSQCWPNRTVSNNMGYNNAANPDAPTTFNSQFPGGVALSGDGTQAQFMGSDPNSLGSWILKSTSPGHNMASDGTDIGVDCNALQTALGASGMCGEAPQPQNTKAHKLIAIAMGIMLAMCFGLIAYAQKRVRIRILTHREQKMLGPEPINSKTRPRQKVEQWKL